MPLAKPGPTAAGTNAPSQQAGHDKDDDDKDLKQAHESEHPTGQKEKAEEKAAPDPNVNVQIKNNGQNVIGLYAVGVNPDGTVLRSLMQKLKKGDQLVLNDNVRAMEVRLEPDEA